MKTNNTVTVKTNQEPAGIEIYFSAKPSATILEQLKAEPIKAGWNRTKKCWYCHFSQERWDAIKALPFLKGVTLPSDTVISALAKVKAEQDAKAVAEGKTPAGTRKPKKATLDDIMALMVQQQQELAALKAQNEELQGRINASTAKKAAAAK